MNRKSIAVAFSFLAACLPDAGAAGVQRAVSGRSGPAVRLTRPAGLSLPASKVPGLAARPAQGPSVSSVSRQRQAVGRIAESVAAQVQAMQNPSMGGEGLSKVNSRIAESLTGERLIPSSEGVVRFLDGSIKRGHGVANPAEFYERAYGEALAVAKGHGKTAEEVHFGWARGEMPMNGREQLSFAFYIMDAPGDKEATLAYVSFSPSAAAGKSEMRVFDVPMTPVEGKVYPRLDGPDAFRRASQLTADAARGLARDAVRDFGHRARFILRWTAGASGVVDLQYRLSDHHGHEAAVNPRTGEVRVIHGRPKGNAKKGLVTDEEVAAAARGAIAYKGMPHSETEYNSVLYPAADRLRELGASKGQVEDFFKLCQDAPIKGGSFNSWSGD